MPDLEQRLADLGAAIDWPATPELATRVVAHLPTVWGGRAAKRPAWGWSPTRNHWALAAAAALLVAAGLFAYTPSRDAIASWVNLHVFIQRVQHQPTPPPLPSGPIGTRLGLGNPTTLDAALHAVGWAISVPPSLGAPDEVYLQQPPDGPAQGEVTLVYGSRPGIPVSGQTGVSLLVTEARGQVATDFFGKMLGPDATLEQVTVAGHQGYWIAGKPHIFFFLDADGNVRNETMRLATNTLIFDDNGTIIRIEGDLTKAQALQMYTSMS
jgi:hypothetical protein